MAAPAALHMGLSRSHSHWDNTLCSHLCLWEGPGPSSGLGQCTQLQDGAVAAAAGTWGTAQLPWPPVTFLSVPAAALQAVGRETEVGREKAAAEWECRTHTGWGGAVGA